jgi:hypothetical protein
MMGLFLDALQMFCRKADLSLTAKPYHRLFEAVLSVM